MKYRIKYTALGGFFRIQVRRHDGRWESVNYVGYTTRAAAERALEEMKG